MKMLKATWISAMLQPWAWWIGLTNSVQAYCRLAISTMHSTPSQSWTQRFGALLRSRICGHPEDCLTVGFDPSLRPFSRVMFALCVRAVTSNGSPCM